MTHSIKCPRSGRWFQERECREFSTDGTRIGAEVAHLYGTKSEAEIERLQEEERIRNRDAVLTGMSEEQADWEASE